MKLHPKAFEHVPSNVFAQRTKPNAGTKVNFPVLDCVAHCWILPTHDRSWDYLSDKWRYIYDKSMCRFCARVKLSGDAILTDQQCVLVHLPEIKRKVGASMVCNFTLCSVCGSSLEQCSVAQCCQVITTCLLLGDFPAHYVKRHHNPRYSCNYFHSVLFHTHEALSNILAFLTTSVSSVFVQVVPGAEPHQFMSPEISPAGFMNDFFSSNAMFVSITYVQGFFYIVSNVSEKKLIVAQCLTCRRKTVHFSLWGRSNLDDALSWCVWTTLILFLASPSRWFLLSQAPNTLTVSSV